MLNVLNDYMSKTDKIKLLLFTSCFSPVCSIDPSVIHFEGNILSTIYKHVYTLDYFRTVVKGVIS